jgi:hypothetical protein
MTSDLSELLEPLVRLALIRARIRHVRLQATLQLQQPAIHSLQSRPDSCDGVGQIRREQLGRTAAAATTTSAARACGGG